jgi:hypothetical protein
MPAPTPRAPHPAAPAPAPPRPQPAPPVQGPIAAGPVVSGPVASGPVASGPRAAAPPAPAPAKKGGIGKFIVIGLVLLLLGGVALAGLAGVAYFVLRDDGSDGAPELGSAEQVEPAAKAKAKAEDTAAPEPGAEPKPASEPQPKPAPKPQPQPTTQGSPSPAPSSSAPRPSSSSGGSTGSGSRPGSSGVSAEPAAPNPDEIATGGEYTVRFVAQGAEAVLECFDGRDKVEFINATRQTFTGVVTCRVHVDGAMGVVQVRQEGTVACVASGGKVSCAAQ